MNGKRIGITVLSVVASVMFVGAASAQQDQPAPPPQQEEGQFQRGRPGIDLLRDLAQIVADDLGIEPSVLVEQLRGQTLAEVITANDGDINAISAEIIATVTERVNEAVTNGNLSQERADQILANLDEMVQRALNGEFRGMRPGLRGDRPLRDEMFPLINAASEATGLTPQEMGDELRTGATLGEVITANGGDPNAVVADAVATVKERLDQAVANGRLTQEQEDAILNGAKAMFEAALSGAFHSEAADASV